MSGLTPVLAKTGVAGMASLTSLSVDNGIPAPAVSPDTQMASGWVLNTVERAMLAASHNEVGGGFRHDVEKQLDMLAVD